MKTTRIIGLVLLAAAVIGIVIYLTRGGKSGVNAKVIPGNSAIVVSFDLKSLFKKAEMKEVQKMSFFRKAMDELEQENKDLKVLVEQAIQDPSKSGLDYSENAYFFLAGNREKDETRTGFTMAISNKGKFETFLKKLTKSENPEIKTEKDYSYTMPDSRTIVGWNKDVLLILGGTGSELKQALATQLAEGKAEDRITSNKRFNDFAKTDHDIGMLINGSQFYSMIRENIPMMQGSPEADSAQNQMKAMQKYYEGMYSEMLLNFESDKISMKARQYFDDPKKEKEMEQIYGKHLDKGMLNAITPDNILALAGASINMDAIWKFLNDIPSLNAELEKELDKLATKTGVEKAKLKNLLTGDFTAAIFDIKPIRRRQLIYEFPTLENGEQDYSAEPQTHYETKMDLLPAFTVTLGVKDRQSMEKILNTAMQKTGNIYTQPSPDGMALFLVPSKAGLTMTNDSAAAVILAEKGEFSATPKKSLTKLLTDNSFAMYVELDEKNIPEKTKNNIIQQTGETKYNQIFSALGPLENLTVWGNASEGVMELNITKSSGHNSLYTLLKYIDDQTKR